MTVEDGFTTATAPWWFVAVLAGVLAIVSTLLGALVSVWSTAASDRRHAEAEKAKDERLALTEWQGTLRQLSANFIVTTRHFVKATQAHYASEQDPTGATVWRRDPNQQRADLAASFLAYWELVLAADAETSRLARDLMRQVRRYERAGQEALHTIDNREWTRMRAAVVSARGALAGHVIQLTAARGPEAP